MRRDIARVKSRRLQRPAETAAPISTPGAGVLTQWWVPVIQSPWRGGLVQEETSTMSDTVTIPKAELQRLRLESLFIKQAAQRGLFLETAREFAERAAEFCGVRVG